MSVRARALRVRLGRFELGPVELPAVTGEVVAIVGPNGGGKTTLLRALAGLVDASDGAADIDGVAVRAMRSGERARRIAFVPQRPAVPTALSVRELVALGRLRGGADDGAIERALAVVGLAELSSRPMSSLSAGQVHRAAVARALCQCGAQTRLLALDEPTAALDPAWSRRLAEIVRDAAARGIAVLVATHDLAFAGACADRALLLADGRLVACGPWQRTATAEALGALFGTPFGEAAGLASRPLPLPRW